MGLLEQESRKKSRQMRLQKIILQSVATVGLLGIGLLVPNVLGAMAKLGLLPKGRQKERIATSREGLIRSGLLEFRQGFLRLTEAGEKKLRLLELREYQVPRPKRWDGRWRVLIFDIPEKRRSTREKVRHTLLSIGFERLQDSVWVYPYDCEDLVLLLKAYFGIGKDLLYLIVESVENDTHLRRDFGLP